MRSEVDCVVAGAVIAVVVKRVRRSGRWRIGFMTRELAVILEIVAGNK